MQHKVRAPVLDECLSAALQSSCGCCSYLDMVFWMPWRCWLVEDFSDLEAPVDPEGFPAPLGAPVFPPLDVLGSTGPPSPGSPGPPAEESACPTAAMAPSLSLGRVLVEPME